MKTTHKFNVSLQNVVYIRLIDGNMGKTGILSILILKRSISTLIFSFTLIACWIKFKYTSLNLFTLPNATYICPLLNL